MTELSVLLSTEIHKIFLLKEVSRKFGFSSAVILIALSGIDEDLLFNVLFEIVNNANTFIMSFTLRITCDNHFIFYLWFILFGKLVCDSVTSVDDGRKTDGSP